MASQAEETFSLVGVVPGHHIYKSVWTPLLGEALLVHLETKINMHDKYAVVVVKGGRIVDNVPHQLLSTV